MSQFRFDPETYLDLMEAEVPDYRALEDAVAEATSGTVVTRLLDLGTGTGETLAAVWARHPGVALGLGLDKTRACSRRRAGASAGQRVEFSETELTEALPRGPFDLVVSALAVHHLWPAEKAALFARIAAVLAPGGRFVLGDVVVPEDPAHATTHLTSDHDRPDTVADQLDWLAGTGFEATVVWRAGDLVVLCAQRPG